MICCNLSRREDVFRGCRRSNGVGPSGIEGEMRDELGDLRGYHAARERESEVMRKLDRLIAGHQRGQGDDASIPGREARALPYVAKQALIRVFAECGGGLLHDVLHVLSLGIERRWRCEQRGNGRDGKCLHDLSSVAFALCRIRKVTTSAPSTAIVLARNTDPSPVDPAISPRAGLPTPSAMSRH